MTRKNSNHNHLGKTSTVLRVATHIYGVSQEIDVKTFIFCVNLGMCNPSNDQSDPVLEGFNTHLWGFSGDKWENKSLF